MRIAVMSMYSGVAYRGVEAWSADLCRRLGMLGHDCMLIQGGPSTHQVGEYQTVSVKYVRPDRSGDEITGRFPRFLHRHGMDVRTRELLGFATRCLPPLRRHRPDVIIPTNGKLSILAASLYRRAFNPCTQIVVAGHAGFDGTLQQAPHLGANGLVALEPFVYSRIRESSTLPTRIIPNGVDCQRFQSAAPLPLNLRRPVVLTTAALIPVKRLHLAIEAVAETNLSLLMLGDGPLRDELTTLGARLLGSNRFRYHPPVPWQDIPRYYAAADVYTLPTSPAEAFGVAIVEALASGIPTVLPDDPIRRWIAGDAALLVDPTDRMAYARALLNAATLPRASDISAVRERFDWSSVAQEWVQFFDELHGIHHKGDVRRGIARTSAPADGESLLVLRGNADAD